MEPSLSPRYSFTRGYWSSAIFGPDNSIQNFMESHMDKKNLIPLRGPINKKTLSCNEDGVRRIINNDKYGFKNLNSIYEKIKNSKKIKIKKKFINSVESINNYVLINKKNKVPCIICDETELDL